VTGGSFNCVISLTGEVRCWGDNLHGQVGIGNTEDIGDDPGELPPPPTDLGSPVAQLALGFSHGCAVRDSGDLHCWGYNGDGELGQGNTTKIGDGPGEMPPPIVDVGAGNIV